MGIFRKQTREYVPLDIFVSNFLREHGHKITDRACISAKLCIRMNANLTTPGNELLDAIV